MASRINERLYEDGVASNNKNETPETEVNPTVVGSGAEVKEGTEISPEKPEVINNEVVADTNLEEEVVEEPAVDDTSGFDKMSNYFDEEDGVSSSEFEDISLQSKAITDAQLAEAEEYEIPQNAFLKVNADADKAFEEAQNFGSQLTRAVAGGVYKGTMTFIQNVGYIADVPQWFGFSNSFEEGYTNMLSEWAGERKEKYDEYNGIYGDSAMAQTMRGLQGLVDSTVGFAGIGAGAGSLVKGATGLIGTLVKMGKIPQQIITQLGTAAVTNYAESVMMGAEMHKEIMDKALANDVSYAEAVKIADSEVSDFMLYNKVNVFTDAIALRGIIKGNGTIRGGMKQGFKQQMGNHLKDGLGESFEEMSAGFFQKDNTRDALIQLGLEQKDKSSYLGRATDYATSEEGLTEGFMGFIGGPFQHYTVKAFSASITKAREAAGLIDPVTKPKEFTEERPKRGDIVKEQSVPEGPAPLDPVEKYMAANKGVSKEDASKVVTAKEWDDYREKKKVYDESGVSEDQYNESVKEFDAEMKGYQERKNKHTLEKQEYVNYIENRRLGTNLKAKEDLDKFFKEEGNLMMAYKDAVLDEDGTAMEDIENQRFEGLFARYANRGMIEGLENHLKEVEAGGEGYTAEDQTKATALLSKLEGYSSDYMSLYNKHGTAKANDLFKLKSRIDGLKQTMTAIDKDLDVSRNSIIKEVKSVSGKDVSPLQLELMATKAEMVALNQMRSKLNKNPELKIGLAEQLIAKEAEIEKKIGKLEEEVKVKKGDGSESFGKYISDNEIESLDSYKKFVETAGKKMSAWVGYQGLSKTFEFENSAKSKKLLRKKYHEYLTNEIETKTFNEKDVYTNLAMIGKVELSKKQRQDLIDKLNVANKEITDEMNDVKDQVMRSEKRINAIKRMKIAIDAKSSKAWDDWKEKNEYDFKEQRDKVSTTGRAYSKAKQELNAFEQEKQIGKYGYMRKNKEGLTLQEKQKINIKYSPTEYKRLKEAESSLRKEHSLERAEMKKAISERAVAKTVYKQKKEQVAAQREKMSARYDIAINELKAIEIHETADGFKYRVDKYLETLVDGNIDSEFEEENTTEVIEGEGGGDGALVVGKGEDGPIKGQPTETNTGANKVPTEVPEENKLSITETVAEVNENGLKQAVTNKADALQAEIDALAKAAGVNLEAETGPKEVPDGISVVDLTGVTDNSQPGNPNPEGTTQTTSETLKAVTEVITENLDPSGKLASEVAAAATAQEIAADKANKDVVVTDVTNPEINPPISNSHNSKQKGMNEKYGWSLAYVSSSDGVGDLDDSGISDWLESEITDKRGTSFRFEVDKADGKAKWATKGEGEAAKAIDKFFNDPNSLTEEDMQFLPIRMVAYDRNGNKIKVLAKEVYGRFKLPFDLNVEGQYESVTAARKDIIKALLNGETYETKIESVSTGILKSDTKTGLRNDPSEFFDKPKANGEGKLLVSDGVGLVYDTKENIEDEELENSGRASVGGLAGFVFMKVRSLDNKPFPLKLNSRKLENKEIQAIMEVLVAYAEGADSAALFNGKSNISGLRNKDIMDLLIYTGQASLNTEYPFWINLSDKPSPSITFGKNKKKVELSELQESSVQLEIAESLAVMWRTTNAKFLNQKLNQTDVGNTTFTWFGDEIPSDTNYNDFQFSQKALSTNATFPSNRLFVNPTVIMSEPKNWKKIGGKKETSNWGFLTGTGKEEITKEDIHEFYDYDDTLAGIKAISDPSIKSEPVLSENFYNKTWLGLDALRIKANNYTTYNALTVFLKEQVFPNNEEAKQLVEEIRSTLKKRGDESIISTLQEIATNYGTKDMPAKRVEAGKRLIEILLKNGEDSFFKKTTGFKKSETKRTSFETDAQKKIREKEEEISKSNDEVKPSDLKENADNELTDISKLTELSNHFKEFLPKNNTITITQGGRENTFNVKSRNKSKSFYTAKEAIEYLTELYPKVRKEIEDAGDKIGEEEVLPVAYIPTKVKPLTDAQYLNKVVDSFGKTFDIGVRKGAKSVWYVEINGKQTTFKGKDAVKDAINFVIASREFYKIRGKLPSRDTSTKSETVPDITDPNSNEVFYIRNPNAPKAEQKKSRYFIKGSQILNHKGVEVFAFKEGTKNTVRNKIFANYQIKKGDAVVVEDSYVDKNGKENKFKYVVNRKGVVMSMSQTDSGAILKVFGRTKNILEESVKAFAQKDAAAQKEQTAAEIAKEADVDTTTPGPNEFKDKGAPKKKAVYQNKNNTSGKKEGNPLNVTQKEANGRVEGNPENQTDKFPTNIPDIKIATSLEGKGKVASETDNQNANGLAKPNPGTKKVRNRREVETLTTKQKEIVANGEVANNKNKGTDTQKAEQLVRHMISGKIITDFTPQEQTLINTVPIERKKEIEKEIKDDPTYSIYSKRKTEADITKELENLALILPHVPVEVAKTLIAGAYGGVAEGQFYQGVVTIANGANEGIAYHEGFHAVMDGYLTLRERNNLLKKVQKKYAVNAAQAEEILAEEFREYMLSKRTMKVPNSVKWIYDLLMDLVDAFRTNKGKIFSQIRRGRFDYIPPFAHSKRIINSRLKGGIKQDLIHEAVDHITYQAIQMAGIRSMDLSVQEGFEDLDDIFEIIRKDIVNEINMAYDEADVTDDWVTFDQLELLHSADKKLDNWKDLVELSKDSLKSFALLDSESITDETPMGETQEDDVSGDLNIRQALTYSGKDNATHNTRFMVKMLADPNTTSKNFGGKFKKLAPFEVSWRMLEDSLANIVEDSNGDQVDKMLNKIKSLAVTHPEFNELISQLEAPDDVVPLFKKVQFYRAFSKQKITYNHTGVIVEGEEYNYKIGNADQQSHAKLLRNQFSENFRYKFIENGDFKPDTATEVRARKKLSEVVETFRSIAIELNDDLKGFNKRNEGKFDFSYYITISDALDTLGIEVSPESLQSYVMGSQLTEQVVPGVYEKVTNASEASKFRNSFLKKMIFPFLEPGTTQVKDANGKIIKSGSSYARNNKSLTLEKMISKDYDFDTDENSDFITENSIFQTFASIEGYRKKDTLENMVLGPENNLYWTKSLNNFISKNVNQWKQDHTSLSKLLNSGKYHQSSKWIKFLLGDEYDFNSLEPQELSSQSKQRLEEFAVQVYLSNRVENDSSDPGTAFKNMTTVDMQLDSMNKVLNGVRNKNGSVFSPLTLADKSSHFMFTGLPMDQYRVAQNGQLINVDKNGNADHKAVEDMFQYFTAEVDRYSNARNKKNKTGNEYFDNEGSKKFFWFPELSFGTTLAKEIGLFDSKGVVNISDEKVVIKVKNHIKETIELQHEKAVQTLKDNNIIKENPEGGLTIIGIDSTVLNHYQNENATETDAVNNMVLDYMVNSMTANIEFTMLFTGDPAFYKDISKRTPATSGQGSDLIFTKDEFGKYNTPKDYKILVIKDADTETSEQYDDYLNHLMNQKIVRNGKDVNAYTKEEAIAILKPYRKNELNKADGQAFITPERFKSLMIGLGNWPTNYDEAFERLMDKDGDPDPRDLLAMQPLKGMHFELRNENGSAVPTYLKYSQAVLWPSLVKGTSHEGLLKKMRNPNNPIDEVIYESGAKSGAGTVYNKEDVISGKVDYKTTTLSNYHWKLQQDLPTKYEKKGEALVGSQPRKNIFQNMFERNANGEYVREYVLNGKKLTPDQMAQKINAVESVLSHLGRQKFDQKYDVVNGRITNQEAIYEHLIEKFKRDNVDMNVIEQLETRVPLSLIFQHVDKIEQEIFAELKKATIKLTSTGGSFVQIAGEGFEKTAAYSKIDKFTKNNIRHLEGYDPKSTNKLKGPRIREDGSLSAQVYLPFKDVENIPGWENMSDKDLKDALGDTIKNIVGYRIPNQKISGMDSLEIVGILPPSAGDSVVVYDEITGKTGSDFDIDKMYVMMYNTVFNPKSGILERVNNKNSKLAVNPKTKKKYGARKRAEMALENERLEMWASVLESKGTFTDAILPVDTTWLKNEAYYLHLLNYISEDNTSKKDGLEDVLTETLGIRKNTEEFVNWFKNTKYATDDNVDLNLFLDEKGDALSPTEIFNNYMALPTGLRDEAAAKFFKQRPGSSLEFASPFTQNEIRERNLGGKAGVGITANHLTHHNLLQAVKMAEIYSTDGRSISETLSAYMNAYVDNAKDPFISLINNNLNTANTVFYMLRQGMSASTANRLLSLPEIRNYVKNIDSQNSKLIKKEKKDHIKILGLTKNGSLKTTSATNSVINPWSKTFEKFSHLNMKESELEKLTSKGPNEFTEAEIEEMIVSGESDPGLILFFMEQEQLGRKFNKMVTASKYDTTGPGSGIAEHIATKQLEQEVLDGEFAEEYKAIINETFVGAMKETAFDDVQTLMSNLFSTAKKPMIDLVIKTNQEIGLNSTYQNYDGTDVEFNRKVLKAYQTYSFSNALNLSPENTKAMFFGDRSMAKRLLKLRNTELYSSNSFLNSLGTLVNPGKGPDFVTFASSKKKEGREKDPLWLEWEELYDNEETKAFATDLIKYAYASSGFQKNINSFYDLIPNTILQRSMEDGVLPFNSIMENTFAEGVNFDTFFDQFIGHNVDILPTHTINDKKLKGIADKTGALNKYKGGFSVDSKYIPYSFYSDHGEGKLRKFIVLTPKKKFVDEDVDTGYKHETSKLLYKRMGEKGGKQYYKRVPTLGMSQKGNHITEYAYDTEVESSIVSPFESTLSPDYENSIGNQSSGVGYITNDDSPSFRNGNEPILEEVTEETETEETEEENVEQYYEGNITPEPNTIFVFGSNPEGRHGKGAAKIAKDQFGATSGQGEGLQGNAYALPTKDLRIKENRGFKSISKGDITTSIIKLYEAAKQNPNKQFKVAYRNTTEMSLNGYTGLEMIEMFNDAEGLIDRPSNIVFSKEWVDTGMLKMNKTTEQTPAETTISKLDGLQEVSKQSSLATVESDIGEESVYKLGDQVLERQSNYVTRKLGVEYNGIKYSVDFKNGKITNLKTGAVLKGGITSPIGKAVVDKAIKQSEAKPAMKAGASVGNFVDNVGRDIFDGGKVKTLAEYVKEADTQNKENGFKLNNVTQKEFDLLVDHLTSIKSSFPDMKFISKELFLNANFTAEQIKAQGKDGIGGTLDLLGVDSDGKLHIIDFKNKIFNSDKQQFWDSNLYNDGMFESKLTGWSRQLSIYKEMLEQKGFEVATTSILLVPTEYSYDTEGNIEFGKFHSPNSVGKPIPEEHQSILSSELIEVPQDKEMVEQFRKDTVADVVENKASVPKVEDLPKPPSIEEIKNEDESVVKVFRVNEVSGFRVEVRREIVEGSVVYQAYIVDDVLIENVDKDAAADLKEGKSMLPKGASTQEEAVALAKAKISRFDIQGLLLSLNNSCK